MPAEEMTIEFPSPIAGQLNHTGGQRFVQRRVVAHGTVAPLMQTGTGGIDGEGDLVI